MSSRRRWSAVRKARSTTPAFRALIVIGAVILFRVFLNDSRSDQPNRERFTELSVKVRFVLDGDTFDCAAGRRVRLLGIDAPEVAHPDQAPEPYSRDSADWLKQRIEKRTVRLQIGEPATDRYQRTLAWVYDERGELINREILRAGWARLLPDFGLPPDLEFVLRRAEAEARVAQQGLWKKRRNR
ncbi:MAG: thermonuclease family protein [Planctomyces sp.]